MAVDSGRKFREMSNLSFEEVFDFAYRKLVPILRRLAEEFGENRFLDALLTAAFDCALKDAHGRAQTLPSDDLAAFADTGAEPSRFAEHLLTSEIVEDTPRTFELRVTECLWAKTFRALGAEDIGYRLLCNTDYADCRGFTRGSR